MKWVIRIVVLLIGVIVAACIAGYISIDHITKAGIEKGGTYAMGVDTKVDNVSLGLFSGNMSMNGLSVANPQGFKADHFFKLNQGDVAVSLGSLMEDTVVIPSLKLDGIDIALEKDQGKANYDVILEHLAKVTGSDAEPADDSAEGKKFIINELLITDINVTAEVIGGVSVPVKIPEIKMTNIGTESDKGVMLKDLSGIILTSILATVVEQAGGILPGGIGEGLQGGLQAVGDLGEFGVQVIGDVTTAAGQVVGEAAKVVGETAEKLGESAEGLGEAAKNVGEEAGKAVEGLGGLLGGKKKEDEKSKETKE